MSKEQVSTNNIFWAGMDEDSTVSLRSAIKRKLGREVEHRSLAHESLRRITEMTFPLLIVEETMAPGKYRKGRRGGDVSYAHVSSSLIQDIRKMKQYEETPLIVYARINSPETPFDLYVKAGATRCYETFRDKSLFPFVNLLGEYLGAA